MAPKGDVISAETTCAVRVAPSVVEADAQVTLQVKVSCSPVCDLRGHNLLIKDHAGADVTRIELSGIPGALKCILWDTGHRRIASVAEYQRQENSYA